MEEVLIPGMESVHIVMGAAEPLSYIDETARRFVRLDNLDDTSSLCSACEQLIVFFNQLSLALILDVRRISFVNEIDLEYVKRFPRV